MKTSLLLGLVIAFTATSAAMASEKLAQDKQCFGCHTANPDGAGPSFQKIAQLRKGTKDAETKLVAIIRQGSAANTGPHWNKATMPDQSERPLVSKSEARKIAKWILTQ